MCTSQQRPHTLGVENQNPFLFPLAKILIINTNVMRSAEI